MFWFLSWTKDHLGTGRNVWGTDIPGAIKSDLDLFLYGVTNAEEATRIVRRLYLGMGCKIQIVLRLYESPSEVLIGFDVDCVCCAYDGRNVWLTQRCIAALKSGFNILNPLHAWPNKASYELRLAKYATRGFPVLVPGLQKQCIDHDRIGRSRIEDLQGMARFIKVSHDMESNSLLKLPQQFKWCDEAQARQGKLYQPNRAAERIPTLCDAVVDTMTEGEKLGTGLPEAYYTDHERSALVLRVFLIGIHPPSANHSWERMIYMDSTMPLASATRNAAWAEIISWPNVDTLPAGIPQHLCLGFP